MILGRVGGEGERHSPSLESEAAPQGLAEFHVYLHTEYIYMQFTIIALYAIFLVYNDKTFNMEI